jgi:hypothetical protein
MVLAMFVLVFTISMTTSSGGRTVFGPQMGADFAAFYVAGRIWNEHGANRIYDLEVQQQLYQDMFQHISDDSRLPYVNAPYFALPFALLARLSYTQAYLLWVLISIGLYLTGLMILRPILHGIPNNSWTTGRWLALSFMPFLVECLAGGQTSAVAFFFFAFAIRSDLKKRFFLSGLALAICFYKPTLLLLTLPMLSITRRWVSLTGVFVGGALLGVLSLLLVGKEGFLEFVTRLMSFAQASTAGESIFRSFKYVDLNSMLRALLSGQPYLRWGLFALTLLAGLLLLINSWWESEKSDPEQQSLVWAVTIAATLVMNVYVGIYDATLTVLSVLLMLDGLYRRGMSKIYDSLSFKMLLLSLYFVPWISQPLARVTGIQLFTFVLAFLMVFQTRVLTRMNQSRLTRS